MKDKIIIVLHRGNIEHVVLNYKTYDIAYEDLPKSLKYLEET